MYWLFFQKLEKYQYITKSDILCPARLVTSVAGIQSSQISSKISIQCIPKI